MSNRKYVKCALHLLLKARLSAFLTHTLPTNRRFACQKLSAFLNKTLIGKRDSNPVILKLNQS